MHVALNVWHAFDFIINICIWMKPPLEMFAPIEYEIIRGQIPQSNVSATVKSKKWTDSSIAHNYD